MNILKLCNFVHSKHQNTTNISPAKYICCILLDLYQRYHMENINTKILIYTKDITSDRNWVTSSVIKHNYDIMMMDRTVL
jgi:hypothetical protein